MLDIHLQCVDRCSGLRKQEEEEERGRRNRKSCRASNDGSRCTWKQKGKGGEGDATHMNGWFSDTTSYRKTKLLVRVVIDKVINVHQPQGRNQPLYYERIEDHRGVLSEWWG